MFRELEFPLKDIKMILDNPDFDPQEALTQQIHLLELKLKHTEKLISFARKIQEKGVNNVDFHAFDKTGLDQYAAEVRERWGNTKAYEEYQAKMNEAHSSNFKETAGQLMSLFAGLGALRQAGKAPQNLPDRQSTYTVPPNNQK